MQMNGKVSVAPLGAIELKRCYQRNMLVAELILLLTIGAVLTIAAALFGGDKVQREEPEWVVLDSETSVQPPPVKPVVIVDEPTRPPEPPTTKGLEPVDDTDIIEEYVLPTRDDYSIYNSNADSLYRSGNGFEIATAAFEEVVPRPDSFFAVDERPIPIFKAPAVYPEPARKIGVEGKVWLNVLVDRDGSVRDVKVAISAEGNYGFDEAAVAAAWQSRWRPAMQNKQPVMVWVSYEVRFMIK